jgi:hypothetical protein
MNMTQVNGVQLTVPIDTNLLRLSVSTCQERLIRYNQRGFVGNIRLAVTRPVSFCSTPTFTMHYDLSISDCRPVFDPPDSQDIEHK